MSKRKKRRSSRKFVIQIFYANEISHVNIDDVIDGNITIPGITSIDDYCACLLNGIMLHKEDIDNIINKYSKNWSLKRIPIMDKLVLRLAIYEIYYVETTPVSVSINEAVELAKQFGCDDESYKFINGILGKVANTIEVDNGE